MSAQVHCRGPLLLLYCKLLSSQDKVGKMDIHHMVKPNQFLKRLWPFLSLQPERGFPYTGDAEKHWNRSKWHPLFLHYRQFYIHIYIEELFIFAFGCAGSLLLQGPLFFCSCGKQGLLSSCVVRASHCLGFSCCRAQTLGLAGFSSFGSRALDHRLRSYGAWTSLFHSM